jgi:hydroxyacylglutathione hydrolase
MLKIQAISAFEDNYIWFIQAPTSQATLIVDPGDATPVLATLKQQNLIPVAILITHGCHDHVDGINTLLSHYDIPVYGPNNEFIPQLTYPLIEKDEVAITDFPLITVMDIPGHTKGHLGFLIGDGLFCGDALFAAGCGRLHSGPAKVLFKSLQKISQLSDDTKIYCAHEYTEANLKFAAIIEPHNKDIQQRISETALLRHKGLPSLPSSLDLELKTNPFLRCDKATVRQASEQYANQTLATSEQVFTSLRLRKDSF